jgi:membrane protease YdiL (CAAX protease family)
MLSKEDRIFKRRLLFLVVALATLHPAMLAHVLDFSVRSPSVPNGFALFMGVALIFSALAVGGYYVLGKEYIRPGVMPLPLQVPFSIIKGLGAVFSLTAIGFIVIELFKRRFPSAEHLSSSFLPLIPRGYGGPVFMGLVVVCSIAAEEIFFRGFWLSYLFQRLHYGYAIGVSALIYALSHGKMPLDSLALLFFAGVGYALVYDLYGLHISIFVHLFFDGLLFARTFLPEGFQISVLDRYLAVFSVVAFTGICFFLIDLLARHWPREELQSIGFEKMY